jgi:hypothetical protein
MPLNVASAYQVDDAQFIFCAPEKGTVAVYFEAYTDFDDSVSPLALQVLSNR